MKLLAAKCVQAYNEAEKRKALGRPGINPKMAAKKKKKPAVDQAEASRREEPHIVFPASMTGVKPKVPTVASELKKTRTAGAEARKRKSKNTTDEAPPVGERSLVAVTMENHHYLIWEINSHSIQAIVVLRQSEHMLND